MPQIWPMNWILLMLFFVSIFVLFISLVYFNSLHSTAMELQESKSLKSNMLNWKW
uniref:ATP synthase F0 subunit 8 n=1 Tax=Ceriodaphnia cornuta TaxID=1255123 RepID=UPI002237A865|nr:ATP synthase F0 subunit 8 [Ceriodaphnia cornuta]UYS92818.1 ATP synthase F0 subunit 8 [Ceriodaphnia cornuta]